MPVPLATDPGGGGRVDRPVVEDAGADEPEIVNGGSSPVGLKAC